MKYWNLALAAIVLIISNSANAALVSRLGGLAYYDEEADLTWLADASAAGTTMNWEDANSWAEGLNVAGVTGWRLAGTLQPDLSCSSQSALSGSRGFDCTGSELGNLFYNVLGGVASSSITDVHNANYDLFSNIQGMRYWSATEYAPNTSNAWYFSMGAGNQSTTLKSFSYYGWAVQSGDVSAVPVPAAVWLFGSGLIGLLGLARRKKA